MASRRMTERRLQVLKLAAEGNSRAAIGRALHISRDSVNVHMRHVFEILGARNRCHAIAQAYRLGYLGEQGPEPEPDVRATVNNVTALVALLQLPTLEAGRG